jgi:hypothetical protein
MKQDKKWARKKPLKNSDDVVIAPMTVKLLKKALKKMEKEHNKTYKSIINSIIKEKTK